VGFHQRKQGRDGGEDQRNRQENATPEGGRIRSGKPIRGKDIADGRTDETKGRPNRQISHALVNAVNGRTAAPLDLHGHVRERSAALEMGGGRFRHGGRRYRIARLADGSAL
jgi:hypothetical protein